ncbi:MAG: 16S rRNA (uracil(1498)-N(3))-methyltransferase [Alphaproteobacteria bacterium]|nr:16S rRNA (uracil(1498)-N(3))-methyltransferase [Alphaproteobacteria bacterium]
MQSFLRYKYLSKKNRIRIYIDAPIEIGQQLECDEKQSHYLLNVMRLVVGDDVYVFNGKNGEFCCKIEIAQKKRCVLRVVSLFAQYEQSPDIWLLFAPIKKDCMDFVIEKSTELGVVKILPVITEYTINSNVKVERLQYQAIEASEQCRRQDIPLVYEAKKLEQVLLNWDENRKIIYLDESLKSASAKLQMVKCAQKAAILVGPEGGFSEKELEFLKYLYYTYGVTLGKRILRAETAAIAALSCWQALAGDWQ